MTIYVFPKRISYREGKNVFPTKSYSTQGFALCNKQKPISRQQIMWLSISADHFVPKDDGFPLKSAKNWFCNK